MYLQQFERNRNNRIFIIDSHIQPSIQILLALVFNHFNEMRKRTDRDFGLNSFNKSTSRFKGSVRCMTNSMGLNWEIKLVWLQGQFETGVHLLVPWTLTNTFFEEYLGTNISHSYFHIWGSGTKRSRRGAPRKLFLFSQIVLSSVVPFEVGKGERKMREKLNKTYQNNASNVCLFFNSKHFSL